MFCNQVLLLGLQNAQWKSGHRIVAWGMSVDKTGKQQYLHVWGVGGGGGLGSCYAILNDVNKQQQISGITEFAVTVQCIYD